MQAWFNTIYLGLNSQGFRQSSNDDICMYRGPDGLKCAVGWLIPDDQYTSDMEGHSIYSKMFHSIIFNEKYVYVGEPKHGWLLFLSELQMAHDCTQAPQQRREELEVIAKSHNLMIPDITPKYNLNDWMI